jgi:hypothetical protein
VSVDLRKLIDPISITALIVSLPSAALAVADLADRIRKRRRAQVLIDCANSLRNTHRTRVYVLTPTEVAPLDGMSSDRLLEIGAASAE